MFRGKVQTIHFVGIGGIGMSGIAEVLLTLGFTVTGSDLREGESVKRLRGLGATVHIGHAEQNIGGADVVVRSTAVSMENPECALADRKGIPVIRRAEMLAELMRVKDGIAIAGTHGKTTTTSILSEIMAEAQLDPTVVIGGRLDSLGGSNARLGQGQYLLAEADESDGSFMLLSPAVAMITNIDPEHMSHYGSEDVLEQTFLDFANKVPFYGFTVLCHDHPTVQRLISQVRRPVVTYGFSRQAEYRASHVEPLGLSTRFRVHHRDQELGEIELALPGEHNVQNATGALALAMELGVSFPVVQRALGKFDGVKRRFTVRADVGGVLIVDDYGHHPVEIDATLSAASAGFPDRRIVAVVQPHRYTRVQELFEDFCGCVNNASKVIVCPVYAAGEQPIDGMDGAALAAGIRRHGHRDVTDVSSLDHALRVLKDEVQPGDVVITLGAGNVNQLCGALADQLKADA